MRRDAVPAFNSSTADTGPPEMMARTHGDTGGAEMHALVSGELPNISPTLRIPNAGYSTNIASSVNRAIGTSTSMLSVDDCVGSFGSDDPHNNMQPWLALNWIIRY